MKVRIKKIEIGANDDFKDIIYEYWITGELQSGIEIKMYDAYCYNLGNEYIGKTIECLIDIEIIKKVYDDKIRLENHKLRDLISGTLKKKYIIPLEWKEIYYKWKENDTYYYAIESKDGIFLLEPSELKNLNIKEGDHLIIEVIRYDLLAWYSIE